MSDSFDKILCETSLRQKGKKFLLLYFIINPELYEKTKIDIEEDICSMCPVGTYDTYEQAFKEMSDIMKKINFGRFKIVKIGSGVSFNNKTISSPLNDCWDQLSTQHLLQVDKEEREAKNREMISTQNKEEEILAQDLTSIHYLRENFSNLCFNICSLETIKKQIVELNDAISKRRSNCLNFISTNGCEHIDILEKWYVENLPKKKESHLVKFFTDKLSERIDNIPKILLKGEDN